ncbi:hypothetical protein [Leucobacter luti]|uniref:hypothetical protein n=1 Tax=Leucobacter luti TaxID=340320 RepID=UPI003D031BC4
MKQEVLLALLALGGVALTVTGAWVGAWLTRRSSKEATEVQAHAQKKSSEHLMIDQLQEELAGHREETKERARLADERATAQDARMNRLELYSDGYRSHAHELRSWIWDGKPPPPPPWPEGLPK